MQQYDVTVQKFMVADDPTQAVQQGKDLGMYHFNTFIRGRSRIFNWGGGGAKIIMTAKSIMAWPDFRALKQAPEALGL